QIDAGVQAHVYLPFGLLFVGRPDVREGPGAAECHRSHGEHGNPQARLTQCTILHGPNPTHRAATTRTDLRYLRVGLASYAPRRRPGWLMMTGLADSGACRQGERPASAWATSTSGCPWLHCCSSNRGAENRRCDTR